MTIVPLFAKAIVSYVRVDEDDAEIVAPYQWAPLKEAGVPIYAYAKINRKTVLMHRLILGVHDVAEFEVDHINGDGLDNRRGNLRLATRGQNAQNRNRVAGVSAYRGVTFQKDIGRWRADARVDGRRYYLGLHPSELAAAKVAARFRAEHMPFSQEDPALLEDVAA